MMNLVLDETEEVEFDSDDNQIGVRVLGLIVARGTAVSHL